MTSKNRETFFGITRLDEIKQKNQQQKSKTTDFLVDVLRERSDILGVMIDTKINAHAVGVLLEYKIEHNQKDIRGMDDDTIALHYSSVIDYMRDELEFISNNPTKGRLTMLQSIMDLIEMVVDTSIHDVS